MANKQRPPTLNSARLLRALKEKILEIFGVSESMPFGVFLILFMCLFFFVIFMNLVTWFIYAFSKPIKPIHLLLSTSAIVFFVSVIFVNVRMKTIDISEWNPVIGNQVELIGEWSAENSKLSLYKNNKYFCTGANCLNIGDAGQWEWNSNFDIIFQSDSKENVTWRLVEMEKKLCLVSGTEGDPDSWKPQVEFTLTNKS